MKNLKLFLVAFGLLFISGLHAQTVKMQWKQIVLGTTGQVAIVGVDGIGKWVTPPFLNIADTPQMLANYQAALALKANDNAVVHLTGNEAITGVKTFNNSPVVPNATTNPQAVNKGQMDAAIATAGGAFIPLAQKGVANGVATLLANGKIPNSQIPAIAISETYVVATQAAMLALSSAEQGDVAVRTDLNKSFILAADPASTLSNWQELLTPTAPASNLSLGAGTGTTQAINNSNGTGVTMPAATTSVAGLFTAAEKIKLNGVATGATANQTDVYLLARANHTGTQTASTISDFTSAARTSISGAGTNSYNSTTGVMTGAVTNLAQGNRTSTTVPVTSSTGTSATLDIATASLAGVMSAIDKVKLDGLSNYIPLTQVAQQFTGSTSTTITLSNAPSGAAHFFLEMNGQTLHSMDYSVSGTTVTLGSGVIREASDYFIVRYSY